MREDTLKAIENYNIKTFGNQKNIEKAESLLKAEEKVIFVTGTNIIIKESSKRKPEKLPGIVFITDDRFVFSSQVAFNSRFESINLEEIDSISCTGNGLTGGHCIISTVTKSYDFLINYKKDDIIRMQATLNDAIATKKNKGKVNGTTANSHDDSIEQLEKLAGLFEKGIITEEEFKAKKQQILGI